MPRALRVIHLLWIAGFLVGTVSHVLDLAAAGTEVYAGFPAGLRVFWISLTVLDLLVVGLLAFRRVAGVVLAVVVILADIAVNWIVFATIGGNPLYGVVNQTVFAVFLLVTAPSLGRWCRAFHAERPDRR
ncbi:hypothetical protein [Propionicicella superfundia]|uniref:hypothetical protein n=1 Tax=Propionicicella superfundia TaxID=348582 RepID=UPI0003FA7FF4|nr:hypothetical protein [Propionicicella superfundia]